MKVGKIVLAVALIGTVSSSASAQIQAGDLVFGLQQPCEDIDMLDPECDGTIGEYSDTLQLVRGLTSTAAPVSPSPWSNSTTPFIGSVQFDNFGGIMHNGAGNLLGVSFGPDEVTGGSIYSFATDGSDPNGHLIAMPSTGLGGNVATTRLTNISVSPDNTKIAVNGYNTGTMIIYDYSAADGSTQAAASNARSTATGTFIAGQSSGTTWLDNDTALGLSPEGTLYSVNANTGVASFERSLNVALGQATLSALEYNAEISPYVFGVVSGFSGTTVNELVVLDPQNGFNTVNQFDFSEAAQTAREIALDADGNLLIGGYSSQVSIIMNAAANATTLSAADINMVFESEIFAAFNGLDVALSGGSSSGPDADFNDDGEFDCDDVDALVAEIVNATNSAAFDLNQDSLVDTADLDVWLTDAGTANVGGAYLPGDADLNGNVDGLDFLVWNAHKFTASAAWCDGDFTANGVVDGLDFLVWNGSKFQSSGGSTVPEPSSLALVALGAVALLTRRLS